MHVDLWRLFGRRNCLAIDSDFLSMFVNFDWSAQAKQCYLLVLKTACSPNHPAFLVRSCGLLSSLTRRRHMTRPKFVVQVRPPTWNTLVLCSMVSSTLLFVRGTRDLCEPHKIDNSLAPWKLHVICRYACQLLTNGFDWRKLGYGCGYPVALVVDFFVFSAD